MKCKNLLSVFLILGLVIFLLPSCKPKPTDADIKAKVESSIANSAVMVDVTEGVVTLSGSVADEAAKNSAEASAKTVEGVQSVTNNLSVMPPPAPVVIADDSALNSSVSEVVKSYSGVTATVSDGVVMLSGSIKKADNMKLMQELNALHPKKIDNSKLTIN